MKRWRTNLQATYLQGGSLQLYILGCVAFSLVRCTSASMMAQENCSAKLTLKFDDAHSISYLDANFWHKFENRGAESFVATFSVLDLEFDIKLERNIQVLKAFKASKAGKNETEISSHFCFFHGTVLGFEKSHAAINLCQSGVNGVISFGMERFILEKSGAFGESLYLIPSSQYTSSHATNCDLTKFRHVLKPQKKRAKRRASDIPSYYDQYLDGKKRYVELVIVNDYSMYARYNYDITKLEDRSIQIANVINSLYQPVNIGVGLVHVEVWNDRDKINISDDGDGTLKAFLHYRKVKLLREVEHDNAQLLSDKSFSSGVVGKALKGTMCSYDMSGGINMDHSRSVVSVASTIAHEMGHNFGMEHDNDSCSCPNNRCIMAPSSGGLAPNMWSSCSLEYLAWGLEHGLDYCLMTPPHINALYKSPTCGNGFVEEGEDCDCGLADVCDNKCCNASLCQFSDGAVCASGACCDTNTCAPKPAATVCRAAKGQCDLAEYCNGEDETCPKDWVKQDGLTCEGGYCGSGQCGSHLSQCKLLWGPTGRPSADVCYALNTKGSIYGNCNYDKVYEKYEACGNQDVMCGRLHCEHANERTEYGDKSVVHTAHTFLTLGGKEVSACRIAQIDLGLPTDRDPGLVPDGAKCGVNKMCSSSKCVEIGDVLAQMACDPPNCNGHGVCNNNAHCHCDYGYGGLQCNAHGFGGSIDSGPAYQSTGFGAGTAVLILVLVMLPIIVLGVVIWYKKNNNVWLHHKLVGMLTSRPDRYKSRPSRPAPPPPGISAPPQANGFINPSSHIVHCNLNKAPSSLVTPVHVVDNPVSTYQPKPAYAASTSQPKPAYSAYPNSVHSLNRDKRVEITPPLPSNPIPNSKPAPYSSQTLPKNAHSVTNRVERTEGQQNAAAPTSNFGTIARKPSFRPEKAPPPTPDRPDRPRESVMERLYAEKGEELGLQSREPSPQDRDKLLPSNTYEGKSDLMREVMMEVEGKVYDAPPTAPTDDTPTPQRRAPPPPADPLPSTSSKRCDDVRPTKMPSPTPEDPKGSIGSGSIVKNRKNMWETKEPVKVSKPQATPPAPPPKPPALHRTLSSAGPSSKPAPISLHRSSSSASSRSSGRSQRPAVAPPAPPPKPGPKPGPPLARPEEPHEFDEIDDENIYDDIMIHSPDTEQPPKPAVDNKSTFEKKSTFATVDSKGNSKISALAAKFDNNSGGGLSRLL